MEQQKGGEGPQLQEKERGGSFLARGHPGKWTRMLFSCSHLHGSMVVDPRVLGQTSGSNGRGQKHENGSQITGPLESKSPATLCCPIPGSTQNPSQTQEGHGMKDCSLLIHDSLIHSTHTL